MNAEISLAFPSYLTDHHTTLGGMLPVPAADSESSNQIRAKCRGE
jgi:hypothetical protein